MKVGRHWRVPETVVDGLVEAAQPAPWLEQLTAALEAAEAATPWTQTTAPRESPRPLAERALELHLDGVSWADIADECGIDQVDARILVLGELQKRVGQDTTAGAGVP